MILDGRRVAKDSECDYLDSVARFTKTGLNKQNILHELYHHIIEHLEIEISEKKEEKEAEIFVNHYRKNGEDDKLLS
jgi:hypothetical protein